MVSKKVIVTSPTLGITTPVMVLVRVIVPTEVMVDIPPIVVVTGEVIVVAIVLVAVPVETAVLPWVPLMEKKL